MSVASWMCDEGFGPGTEWYDSDGQEHGGPSGFTDHILSYGRDYDEAPQPAGRLHAPAPSPAPAPARAPAQGWAAAGERRGPRGGRHNLYAVRVGRVPGVYTSNEAAQAQVRGFPGGQLMGFQTRREAEEYVRAGGGAPRQGSRGEWQSDRARADQERRGRSRSRSRGRDRSRSRNRR